MTDEDRQRLSDTIKQEMTARGGEIRMMSELGGPLGDSAKQFLALADQVEFYNSAAGEQRRKEDKAAQEFNTAMNQFKANIMALSIPFLKLINGIPWDTFIKTLTTFVDVLGFLLTPFAKLGTVLGGSGAGSLIAVVGGVASALLVAKTGYDLLTSVLKNLTGTTTSLDSVFKKLQATLATPGGTLSGGLGDISKGGGPGPGDLSKDNSKKDPGKGGAKPAGKGSEYSKGFGAIAENAAQRKAEELEKTRKLAEAQTKKITDSKEAAPINTILTPLA